MESVHLALEGLAQLGASSDKKNPAVLQRWRNVCFYILHTRISPKHSVMSHSGELRGRTRHLTRYSVQENTLKENLALR